MNDSATRSIHRPTISIVLPILNEGANLFRVLPELPPQHQLVVVDGGSSDGSEAIVRRLRPDAIFLRQTRWGKGNALVCGFEASTGDIIVMFDGDGSANAREIDLFVSTLTLGADFAKGTRYQPGGGSEDITALRGLGNRALTVLANRILGTRYSDLCYGYNAFWRDILPVLDLPSSLPADGVLRWGDGFEIETVLNCRISNVGLVVREVPSVERRRIHGVTNLHAWRDGKRVLRTLITERRRSHHSSTRRVLPARAAAIHRDSSTPPLTRVPSADAGRTVSTPARTVVAESHR